ncbi:MULTISPECIES: thiol peroxidase [unclassified Nocardioides]|uniref:thiol peroxidase n=1 Tax=unclassified Nocardioides TaxID=2615069 RepID=UPI0006F8F7E3|nr:MULTISPECIES: thiol peroxidase [unclassified Nocardioides]KQY57491.1 peroxidase [Nocardioides sp. Root140]KQZ76141.1 peroxidase [Nocardioides sp. Root151]KRF20312.1 peroxidase [Nocardioides sp. Soil796]
MATTAFKGSPVNTVGELPAVGAGAPAFDLVGEGLSSLASSDVQGRTVLNIFPSIDTGICAASVRKFNELAAGLENTTVVNVSKDLPFAQARFCGAEGIENVKVGSAFRSSFGEDFGVTMADGPMAGLLARSVVVLDADGQVVHSELVPEITTEPDYDAAIAALA